MTAVFTAPNLIIKRLRRRAIRISIILIAAELIIWGLFGSGSIGTVLMLALFVGWAAELFRQINKAYEIQFRVNAKPFQPSALVKRYLANLHGVEIGASTQNSYDLPRAINIDFADDPGDWQDTHYKKATVHLVSNGDDLPFKDNTLGYVLSSHNIEHYFDPIRALKEWWRVVRPGGYIIAIVPHKDRTTDRGREETSLDELISRHSGKLSIQDYIYRNSSPHCHRLCLGQQQVPEGWQRYEEDDHHHWSVWKTDNFLELCKYLQFPVIEYLDKDDKVGNGFAVVIQKN